MEAAEVLQGVTMVERGVFLFDSASELVLTNENKPLSLRSFTKALKFPCFKSLVLASFI